MAQEAAEYEKKTKTSPNSVCSEISEWDQNAYLKIVSTELTEEQKQRIANPESVYPHQKSTIAVHWHPEFVPLEIIMLRMSRMFPNCNRSIVIPTQHNQILGLNGYAGLEIDCYSKGFNRKVQLLIHFKASSRIKNGMFAHMAEHTFKYRSTQLDEYLETIVNPKLNHRIEEAAMETGADDAIISFARAHAVKLKNLIEDNESRTPAFMLRNKIVESYFNELREIFDDRTIDRAQVFLKAVKAIVKAGFSNKYFYETEHVIEEARSLGAGIVVPHPEQFWPILLADYDVDGYEVWNPQSREYTEFIIDYVNRLNDSRKRIKKVLVFMGDDTHMSEKTLPVEAQNKEKAAREVGLQPAWEEHAVKMVLEGAGIDRRRVIDEYEERIN